MSLCVILTTKLEAPQGVIVANEAGTSPFPFAVTWQFNILITKTVIFKYLKVKRQNLKYRIWGANNNFFLKKTIACLNLLSKNIHRKPDKNTRNFLNVEKWEKRESDEEMLIFQNQTLFYNLRKW